MKISFLSSSSGWGGLEQNLLRYARWMNEVGHDVELNCVAETALAREAANQGQRIRFIARQPRHYPMRAARVLRRHLQQNSTEVLWVRDPRDLSLCSGAVRGIKTRLLFHQGMQIPKPKKAPWHALRFTQIDAWVAPLEHLQKQVLQNTSIPSHRVHVIPLALGDHWFEHHRQSRDILRTEWGLPLDAQVVGLFGRLDSLKGQRTLLGALAQPEGLKWHALLVGENTRDELKDEQQTLQRLAQTLGVSDRVHWHAPVTDLRGAYDACDAFAMCSMSETFGMVTIEAMARNLPVIGTNAGGTPELLLHGEAGVLFEPNDSKALARALADFKKWPIPPPGHRQKFQKSTALKKWSQLLDSLRSSPS